MRSIQVYSTAMNLRSIISKDTKGDLYNYSIYSNSVDLYGRKENWSEVQEKLIFHFGAVVKSADL